MAKAHGLGPCRRRFESDSLYTVSWANREGHQPVKLEDAGSIPAVTARGEPHREFFAGFSLTKETLLWLCRLVDQDAWFSTKKPEFNSPLSYTWLCRLRWLGYHSFQVVNGDRHPAELSRDARREAPNLG